MGNLFRGNYGTGSTATLSRTVVSGNTAPAGSEIFNNGRDSITTAGFNLFGQSGITNAQAFGGFTPGGSDISATAAPDGTVPTPLAGILAGLAPNGGPTDTHALVTDSPAIDAVTDVSCPPPNVDQRGVSRPQPSGGNCDIGSFEVMVPPDLAVAKSDSTDPVAFGDQLTYTVTVNNAGAGDATGVMLTDTLPSSVDFVSVSPSGSCGESGGEVTWTSAISRAATTPPSPLWSSPPLPGRSPTASRSRALRPMTTPGNNTDSETTNVIVVAALRCNGLVPTIVGTPGDDANLRGTNRPDVIHGLGGNDIISGLNGNDVICGGDGNDTLSGNNGIDQLFGQNGTDTLNGNNGNDALDGGVGTTDTCNVMAAAVWTPALIASRLTSNSHGVTPSSPRCQGGGAGRGQWARYRAVPVLLTAISGPAKPAEAAGAQVPRRD